MPADCLSMIPRDADGIHRVIVVGGGAGRPCFENAETCAPIESNAPTIRGNN